MKSDVTDIFSNPGVWFVVGMPIAIYYFSRDVEFGCECADGWISESIGIQGACSHHGGVVCRTWFGVIIKSFIAATFLCIPIAWFYQKNDKQKTQEPPRKSSGSEKTWGAGVIERNFPSEREVSEAELAPPSIAPCPLHERKMIKLDGKYMCPETGCDYFHYLDETERD